MRLDDRHRDPSGGRSDTAAVNAQYNLAAPDSLPARIAGQQRHKMFGAFVAFAGPGPTDRILDIGVTSDRGYDHSNYFEAWYPDKASVEACALGDNASAEGIVSGAVHWDNLLPQTPLADTFFPSNMKRATGAANWKPTPPSNPITFCCTPCSAREHPNVSRKLRATS